MTPRPARPARSLLRRLAAWTPYTHALIVIAALPWVLHDDGTLLYVVLVSTLAAFFLIVIEKMASVIERPFGGDVNQLRLTPLCETIRRTVGQALDVPPSVARR